MNEAVIKTRLTMIHDTIKGPAGKVAGHGGVYLPQEARQEDLDAMMDSMELLVKYLLFDIEATRRENKYLRQIIETRPQPPRRDEGDFPPGI